ncbi:MAG: hypothetical protein EKK64_00850 [Neisseriaceae bacterium]|nr:MAG: hypothetical protein EKK64_00850 [Neisseriaceae bacterium]
MSEKRKSIIVAVTDGFLPKINDLANSLRKEGMLIDRVFPILGVITGEVLSENIEKIKSIQGVLNVEDDLEMKATA